MYAHAGPKFWRTSKTIKAVSEDDYNDLELGWSSGTARARRLKATTYIHISSGSDSDSGLPLTRTYRKPNAQSPLIQTMQRSTEQQIQAIVCKIESNTEILRTIEGRVLALSPPATDHEILSCIIYKESPTEPLVPKCCNNILVCKVCMQEWLLHSHTCPHCRGVSYDPPTSELSMKYKELN